jgi:hypothetical protein
LHSDWKLARAEGCTTNITYNPIYFANPTFGLNFNRFNEKFLCKKSKPKKTGGFVGALPLVARPPFLKEVAPQESEDSLCKNNPPFVPPSPRGTSSRVLTFLKGDVPMFRSGQALRQGGKKMDT